MQWLQLRDLGWYANARSTIDHLIVMLTLKFFTFNTGRPTAFESSVAFFFTIFEQPAVTVVLGFELGSFTVYIRYNNQCKYLSWW